MTSTSLLSPSAARTDDLRARIDDALSAAGQDDAVERWSSHTDAGRELLFLAAQARRAAATLGADSGLPLVAGPGVVVLRELAAAAHLLDEAVEGATSAPRLLEVA
jgi:16S rRNA C1402 (ribose-2'-O) methylase RsmI